MAEGDTILRAKERLGDRCMYVRRYGDRDRVDALGERFELVERFAAEFG